MSKLGIQEGYTPGPWGVEYWDGSKDMWIGPMRPDGHKVADVVVRVDWDDNYKQEAKARIAANAVLIALAPQMADEIKRQADRIAELEAALDHYAKSLPHLQGEHARWVLNNGKAKP